jgi:hypothetical protein
LLVAGAPPPRSRRFACGAPSPHAASRRSCLNNLPVEHRGEVPDDRRLGVGHRHAAARRARQRRNTAALDTARHDEPEKIEIGRHVQSEPVAGDPPRNADSNCTYLIGRDPRTGEPFDALTLQTEIGGGTDHDFLEVADIFVYIATIGPQVENWISDQLSGPVVGDVAAAPRLVHRDLPRGQHFGRRNQVRPGGICFDAERNYVRMFEKEEKIGNALSPALFYQRLLHIARGRVENDAKPPYFQLTHTLMVACRAVARSAEAGRVELVGLPAVARSAKAGRVGIVG